MSAEALGWVYRYSPFTGSTFAVHAALADSANDQHHHELWMGQATIAAKARCSVRAVAAALGELVERGFLDPLTSVAAARMTNRPRRYRLLFPDVAVVYDTRRPPSDAEDGRDPPAQVADGLLHRLQEPPAQVADEPKDNPTGTQARARPRNVLFDALVDAFGPAETRATAAHYAKVANDLKQANATPEQVAERAASMRQRGWTDAGPGALAKHWTALGRGAPERGSVGIGNPS